MAQGTKIYSKKINCITSNFQITCDIWSGGANNEYQGGPGGGFLVLVAVVACHYVYYH